MEFTIRGRITGLYFDNRQMKLEMKSINLSLLLYIYTAIGNPINQCFNSSQDLTFHLFSVNIAKRHYSRNNHYQNNPHYFNTHRKFNSPLNDDTTTTLTHFRAVNAQRKAAHEKKLRDYASFTENSSLNFNSLANSVSTYSSINNSSNNELNKKSESIASNTESNRTITSPISYIECRSKDIFHNFVGWP